MIHKIHFEEVKVEVMFDFEYSRRITKKQQKNAENCFILKQTFLSVGQDLLNFVFRKRKKASAVFVKVYPGLSLSVSVFYVE